MEDQKKGGRTVGGSEVEEGKSAKGIAMPKAPNQEEVDNRMLTHIPFRDWCAHCVRGRADNVHHRKSEKDDQQAPTISIDYMWMAGEGRGGEEVEGKDKGNPIMVIYDRKSKWRAGIVIHRKGNEPYSIKRAGEEIRKLGYRKIIIKTDQESSIMALKQAVIRELQQEVEVLSEESPVGEHQSNGEVENAVKRVQGQVRVTKDSTEAKYQTKMRGDHHAIPWMIEHAASMINRYQVSEDGKTAYERVKGKKATVLGLEFGETVLFR